MRESAKVDIPCFTDVRLREVKQASWAGTNRLSCLHTGSQEVSLGLTWPWTPEQAWESPLS